MINFFDNSITTPVNLPKFGLCDLSPEDRRKHPDKPGHAFVDDGSSGIDWIATVENPNQIKICFTPIDKGVVRDGDLQWDGCGRCDAMLYKEPLFIYFIELKDKKPSWISSAVKQLESTLQIFFEVHGREKLEVFHNKEQRRAYACNKRYPNAQQNHECKRNFRDKWGVRLFIEATIHVDVLENSP